MEKIYRLLYPMRVVLITTSHGEKENVMSAAWCYPLSANPPLFGVAISKKRYTYELINASKKYAINLATPQMKEAVMICGSISGRDKDKFALAKLKKEKGKITTVLSQSSASIECEVIDEYEAGDHIIFVGKAINVIKRKEEKGLYHRGGEEFEAI
ncbi:MAG: flavin reductase family protein [Candidatus Bilamarchaeaceae archaeon]